MSKEVKTVGATAVSRRTLMKSAVAGAGVIGASGLCPGILRSAQAADDVVHIGASLPLTGPYEKVSKIYRDGYDFWTKMSGGKMTVAGQPRTVKWTIYDDENNASRTAQLTEKLISSDRVDLIAGSYGTDTVLAQGAIAGKHKRVTIQGGAASERVDEEIGGHTTFTLIASSKRYPAFAMDYLAKRSPAPKRVALITMDDPVYREMAEGVKEKVKEHGMQLVFEDVLPMKVQDLRPTALKLRGAGEIDILYNTGWDIICVKLVEEMSALGVNPKAFIGGHLTTSPTVKQTLGKKLTDVYGVTFWLPQFKYTDPHFKSPAEFADAFKKAYGYEPTYHAALSYALPMVYEAALRDADPTNPFDQAALRERIQKVKLETVWGPISFDKRGRIERGGAPVIQWQGPGPDAKVIFPSELAEAEGAYPKRPWA
ncbi:amino acid ABC transporter substrate-binding protein [Azospirillum sp.]|uniref:amino acid ABC transporter substrate-binding protein n=1 Tax=Azospirillum sp. TaxID=34012 RepID=UPI003D75B2E5